MSEKLQQIFASGLSLSLANGRLRVVGESETLEAWRPVLQKYRNEIISLLQPSGEVQNRPAISENAYDEASAKQAKQTQQPINDSKRLSEDESLIVQAVELEALANAAEMVEIAYKLEKALDTIDQTGETAVDRDFARKVLRSAIDEANTALNRKKTNLPQV